MTKALAEALRFLTAMPLPFAHSGGMPSRSMLFFFPAVGALVGCAGIAVHALLTRFFPDQLARVLALAFQVLVAGKFHLDGLADTADGFYGGHTKAEVLRIMSDPHVGVMGALALIFAVLIKASLYLALPAVSWVPALLVSAALGRAGMVLALTLPPAKATGLAAFLGCPGSRRPAVLSGACLVIMPLVFPGGLGWTVLLGSLGVAGAILLLAWKKIRGVTGDVCGAVNEVIECAVLASFLVRTV